MDYVIFTDTSANLPDKVVGEYGLRQIPLFTARRSIRRGFPAPARRSLTGAPTTTPSGEGRS